MGLTIGQAGLMFLTIALAFLQAGLGIGARQEPLNDYEWMAVAPIVVGVESLGENGKWVEVKVTHIVRGDLKVDQVLNIDLRHTNRNRARAVHPRGLRLPEGDAFLLLLKHSPPNPRRKPSFQVVRGVPGSRDLPLEGAEARILPLRELARIQSLEDDGRRWQEMWRLLEADAPVLINTALSQTIKFSRAQIEQLDLIRPLLEHPDPEIRRRSAELIRLIVKRFGEAKLESGLTLRNELVSTARRDPTVSVRAAATEAISAFEGTVVDDILQAIAESDPEQMVRYIAQKALLERQPQ